MISIVTAHVRTCKVKEEKKEAEDAMETNPLKEESESK